jgi:hypothetical protein
MYEWMSDTLQQYNVWVNEWYTTTVQCMSEWVIHYNSTMYEWMSDTLHRMSEWVIHYTVWVNEWYTTTVQCMSECCLTLNELFFSNIMARTSYIFNLSLHVFIVMVNLNIYFAYFHFVLVSLCVFNQTNQI